MKILDRIVSIFYRTAEPVVAETVGPLRIRRWEAAETNRLNSAQWSQVTGQSINADLESYLETIRTRATYEAANNPFVDGVISTHCDDVVGPDGPVCQVLSDDEIYNQAAERIVRDWFRAPCPNPKTSGVAMLKLWVRDLWSSGEFLAQRVTRNVSGPVTLGVKPIHPRRLGTPADLYGDADVVMGVRLTRDGVPTQYYVSEPTRFGAYELETSKFTPVPADMMIHEFLTREEDQVRGVPWLASCLQAIADLRQYDAEVLEAARQAANQAVFLAATGPDVDYMPVNESEEIERGTISTCPPGWQPYMLNPTQPSTQYVDFRKERQAEIARAVGMPLMMVRLDSSNHNYSSARFDGQIYARATASIQRFLGGTARMRGVLYELVDEVLREAELAKALPPRPEGCDFAFLWPSTPHVDPKKEAEAERVQLENGSLAYGDLLAGRGLDEDETIAKRKRSQEKLEKAGLPPLPTAAAKAAPTDDAKPDDEDETDETDETAEEAEEQEA